VLNSLVSNGSLNDSVRAVVELTSHLLTELQDSSISISQGFLCFCLPKQIHIYHRLIYVTCMLIVIWCWLIYVSLWF